MTHQKPPPVAETIHPSQRGFHITLMPTEARQTIEELIRGIRLELSPNSAYEHVLAADIVRVIQEIQRNQNFRDQLIRSAFRELSIEKLSGENADDFMGSSRPNSEDIELVDALMLGVDRKRVEQCLARFAEHHVTPNEILARAVQREHPTVVQCDKQIQSLELRRRNLIREYRQLSEANCKGTQA